MAIQFGMIVLDVRDLRRSIDFYRLLGLDVPEPSPDRPVSVFRMDSGVSLVLIEEFAARNDPAWVRPAQHTYQQLMEFVADDDAAVDSVYAALTGAGHHGRKAPGPTSGIYYALVDDPDGNVLMVSSDPSARP